MKPLVQSRIKPPPPVLPGFDHIARHWDWTHRLHAAKFLPGEYYVTTHDELIITVLGSCVAACIRDPVFEIGGMNHFMLPESSTAEEDRWLRNGAGASTRYGNYAMEQLINDILKHGGRRQHLEVKLFGGGRVLSHMTDIGQRNIAFVREYMHTEGLNLVAEDLGDRYPRKVLYFPSSGKVRMKRLRTVYNDTISRREAHYQGQLRQPVQGEIELF